MDLIIACHPDEMTDQQRLRLVSMVAAYVAVSIEDVKVVSITATNSSRVRLRLPWDAARRLIEGFQNLDPILLAILDNFTLLAVQGVEAIPIGPVWEAVPPDLRMTGDLVTNGPDLSSMDRRRLIRAEVQARCQLLKDTLDTRIRTEQSQLQRSEDAARAAISTYSDNLVLQIRDEFTRTLRRFGLMVHLDQLRVLSEFGEQLKRFRRELQTRDLDAEHLQAILRSADAAFEHIGEQLAHLAERALEPADRHAPQRPSPAPRDVDRDAGEASLPEGSCQANRQRRFLQTCRLFLKRSWAKHYERLFLDWYDTHLQAFDQGQFAGFMSELEESVAGTPSGKQRRSRTALNQPKDKLLAFLETLYEQHTGK